MCGPVLWSSNAAAVSLPSTKLSINLQRTHAFLYLIWQSAQNTGAHSFVAGLLWVCVRLRPHLLCMCPHTERLQHVTRGLFGRGCLREKISTWFCGRKCDRLADLVWTSTESASFTVSWLWEDLCYMFFRVKKWNQQTRRMKNTLKGCTIKGGKYRWADKKCDVFICHNIHVQVCWTMVFFFLFITICLYVLSHEYICVFVCLLSKLLCATNKLLDSPDFSRGL